MERLTENELQFIRLAKGGILTKDGTPADRIALQLEEKGYLKMVTPTGFGTAWKLSGEGCKIAFAD